MLLSNPVTPRQDRILGLFLRMRGGQTAITRSLICLTASQRLQAYKIRASGLGDSHAQVHRAINGLKVANQKPISSWLLKVAA